MRIVFLFLVAVLASTVHGAAPSAQTIAVRGTDNLWLAGSPNGTTAAQSDRAPAQSPAVCKVIPDSVLIITGAGGVANDPSLPLTGSAGGSYVSHPSENGIAGLSAPINSLVGVFLAGPARGSNPPSDDVDTSVPSPAIGSPFYIGGKLEVRVPANATRLYLGTMDAYDWNNNIGGFQALITPSGVISLTDVNDGSAIEKKDTAWITGTNPPKMPSLEAELPGAPPSEMVKWRFVCTYNRPRAANLAEDKVELTKELPASDPWRIHEDYKAQDFFGGDAEVSYQIGAQPKKTLRFRIGGRNPAPEVAKPFIQQLPGAASYLYAIARSESFVGGDAYSQFGAKVRKVKVSAGNTRKFEKGDPLWGGDAGGYGGWGMFQNTPATIIERKAIWNWQENARLGNLNMQAKHDYAVDWIAGQRAQALHDTGAAVPIPTVPYKRADKMEVTFGDGGTYPMEDAVAIKAYNSASRNFCSWNNAAKKWQFNPSNGKFDYVERVVSKIEAN